jgi:hypothetical protein
VELTDFVSIEDDDFLLIFLVDLSDFRDGDESVFIRAPAFNLSNNCFMFRDATDSESSDNLKKKIK